MTPRRYTDLVPPPGVRRRGTPGLCAGARDSAWAPTSGDLEREGDRLERADHGTSVPADPCEQAFAVGGHRRKPLLRPVENLARVTGPARHVGREVAEVLVPRRVVVVHVHRSDHEQVDVAVDVAVTTRCGTVDDDGEGTVAPGASVLGDPRPQLLSEGRKDLDGAGGQMFSVEHEQRRRAGRGALDEPGGSQLAQDPRYSGL